MAGRGVGWQLGAKPLFGFSNSMKEAVVGLLCSQITLQGVHYQGALDYGQEIALW